jgi:hypothetical protein
VADEEGAGAAIEPAAVDEQRLVAVVERRPLDPLPVEVEPANPMSDPVEELEAVGVAVIHRSSSRCWPIATTSPLRSPPGPDRLGLPMWFERPESRMGSGIRRPPSSAVVGRRDGLSGLSRRRPRVRVPSLPLPAAEMLAGTSVD